MGGFHRAGTGKNKKSYRNFPPASIFDLKGPRSEKLKKIKYLWSEMAYFKFYFCFQYLKY